MLNDVEGKVIAEIGGSNSRVLPLLRERNECWNIDKLDGDSGGATYRSSLGKGIKLVRAFLGDNSPELPSNYFDYVLSISVMEHVPGAALERYFSDMARIMKFGAKAFHAIDFYVSDEIDPELTSLLLSLHRASKSAGLEFIEEPALLDKIIMKSDYATHSDMGLMSWNISAPGLRTKRESHQVVSVKCGWVKP